MNQSDSVWLHVNSLTGSVSIFVKMYISPVWSMEKQTAYNFTRFSLVEGMVLIEPCTVSPIASVCSAGVDQDPLWLVETGEATPSTVCDWLLNSEDHDIHRWRCSLLAPWRSSLLLVWGTLTAVSHYILVLMHGIASRGVVV